MTTTVPKIYVFGARDVVLHPCLVRLKWSVGGGFTGIFAHVSDGKGRCAICEEDLSSKPEFAAGEGRPNA